MKGPLDFGQNGRGQIFEERFRAERVFLVEIEDKGEGVYHVYNGDDFFDVPSGYLVKVRGGKVQSCEYKMKLGKKKE